jgi:hypothetical protein
LIMQIGSFTIITIVGVYCAVHFSYVIHNLVLK